MILDSRLFFNWRWLWWLIQLHWGLQQYYSFSIPHLKQLIRFIHYQPLYLVQVDQWRVVLQLVDQSVGRRYQDIVLRTGHLVTRNILDLARAMRTETGPLT